MTHRPRQAVGRLARVACSRLTQQPCFVATIVFDVGRGMHDRGLTTVAALPVTADLSLE